ncbi:MAG: hypothetical protein JWO78_805 [Micavibrio sp.]|nr:hypothetical protein [Micavibrio sp.]
MDIVFQTQHEAFVDDADLAATLENSIGLPVTLAREMYEDGMWSGWFCLRVAGAEAKQVNNIAILLQDFPGLTAVMLRDGNDIRPPEPEKVRQFPLGAIIDPAPKL